MQLTLFVVVLLLGLPVVSPAKEYNPSDLYDVEYFKLENGFDVVLKKRTHVPNVAVRLVVDVGMRHFRCGKQETPHFLEHLLLEFPRVLYTTSWEVSCRQLSGYFPEAW